MVFKFSTQKPKSLHWKELDRVVKKLGAVYLGNTGDHRKYHRVVDDTTYVIIIPEHKDCYQKLIKSIINQSGVSPKEFWAVYNGAKYIKGKGVQIPTK